MVETVLAPTQDSEPDLLVRPVPERMEGPLGYLLRLAEANCMTMHDLSGLDIRYDLPCLVRQRLLPSEVLDPDLYAHVARLSLLLESKVRIWNQRYARFCPQCLAEGLTWQASWELYFHDACPSHGVWLVDLCSSCGKSIRWHRDSLLRCQCGSDLRQESTGAAPDSVRKLSAALADKLYGRSEGHMPLVGLDVDQLQRLVRYLGGYMDQRSNPKPLKLRNAGRLEVSWPISSLAAEILFDWPNAFHQTLNRLQAASADDKAGLSGVFKQAYTYLYKGLTGNAFSSVREAFESWLADNWKGGASRRNRRLSTDLLERVQWIPGNVAAESLGISMARLRFLIQDGVLEGQESCSTSGRRFIVVRRDQLDAIRNQLGGEMTMADAMEQLGIGKVRMQRILRLLFPSARRINDQVHLPWCVPRREVESLLALGSDAPVVCIPEEDQISMGQLLRYWNWTGDEIVGLIEATKAGTIKLQGLLDNGCGVGRWIFDVGELRTFQKGVNSGRSNWVSLPEMAAILGVKQGVVYWLTQHGFVHAERLGALKGIGSRVHRDELERFRRSHVLGKEIADIIGRSSTKTSQILAEQGVFPLIARGDESCPQLIYTRSEQLQNFLIGLTGSSPSSFKLVSRLAPSEDV